MILKLNTQQVQTLQDLRDFTAGNESFDLEPVSHHESNLLIKQTLRKFRYGQLGKADKESVKAHLPKAAGRSRAQITRLIAQHRDRRGIRSGTSTNTRPPPAAGPAPTVGSGPAQAADPVAQAVSRLGQEEADGAAAPRPH